MDYSLPGSSVHGISQARVLEWVAIPFSTPSPRACSNSCPLSRWCHPTVSFSVVPFSSCLQSIPASGSFLMSQWCYLIISSSATLFSFCLQSFPASGSFPIGRLSRQVAKVLDLQLQYQSFQWIFRLISFRIDWLDLAIQGTLKSLLQHHNSKASILWCSALWSNSQIRTWLLEKQDILLAKRYLSFLIHCLGLS